jgi:cation transport regulator ChaC
MSKEKQSRADLQDKRIEALIKVLKGILDENSHLKDLAVGTLQLIKKMPDYDKALEDLTAELKKEEEENAKEIKKPEERKLEL